MTFDPSHLAFLADPYPFFNMLREMAPIHYEESLGGWVFTRYADVAQLQRDPRVVRASIGDSILRTVPDYLRPQLVDLERMLGAALPFSNPPDHTRLRRLVSHAFTPRLIERMRPYIERVADDLLDMAAQKGRIELISELAYPLPTAVIMEFIGVPQEGRAPIMKWAKDIMALLGASISGADPAEAMGIGNKALMEFGAYVSSLVEERRQAPREDLLTALINATADESQLTTEELIVNVMALLNAGLETTSNFIGNGILALLRNPDELAALRVDPSIGEAAGDELLRHDAPTPFATPQVVTGPIEVGGQTLEAGSVVYVVMGAANRDPAKFPDPDKLDLRRANAKHLTFGGGIHYCLGAALARTEGQVVFTKMAARFPDMRIDPDAPAPVYRPDPVLRGLVSLHLRLDPAD
jgi:cytochrome P450